MEREYAYHLQQDGEAVFYAVTTNAFFTIWLERGTTLYPEVKFQRRGNYWPIGINRLAEYYDPSWRREWLEPVTLQDIREILETDANILRRYCTPLLNGDFSEWPKIQEWSRQIAIQGAEERQERSKLAFMADKAFERGEYATAIVTYEKLNRLLPDEKRRLEESKRKLNQ